MSDQSKPYPKMIEFITRLKLRHGLKIAVVSNKARVVSDYRIRKFKLDEFVDFFTSSCFVPIRKPDAGIYRKYPDVRSGRGRFGDSKYPAHGLQVNSREISFVRSPNEVRRASDFYRCQPGNAAASFEPTKI